MRFLLVFIFLLVFCIPANAAEIIFGGDVTLARNIPNSQNKFFTDKTRSRLEEADLFIWNLESSGKSTHPRQKRFVFTSSLDNLSGMRFPNGLATVANNHSFDGGHEGFSNLILATEKHGIPTVGEKSSKNSGVGTVVETNGRTYYVFNFSPMCGAEQSDPTVSSMQDVISEIQDIKKLKNDPFIIVNVHDGIEGTQNISSRQKDIILKMAELGVKILNFTHSHTYIDPVYHKGYKGMLILSGTGNFIFGGNSGWRNRHDVRVVSVDPDTLSWRWLKGRTKDYVFDLY